MKPAQFVKEVHNLFSNSFLYTVDNERPEVDASQKANRKFKALLKSLFPDCEIEVGKNTFCYSYGYVKKDGHSVYINFEDYRDSLKYFPWDKNLLIRTADPEGKTRDGSNHNITDINRLQAEVYALLKVEHRPAF